MPPKPVPKPRLRKGSKTYEVREVIAGKARSRTLGTTDYREALRRFPVVYAAMLAEFENAPPTSNAEAPAPVKTMPLAEASRRYAESLIASEECYRREHGGGVQARHPLLGAPYDPVKLARDYHQRLQRWLAEAQSRFTVRDYQHQEWFLQRLAVEGLGDDYDDDAPGRLARQMFPDYGGALRELARTGVRTIREMIAADEESGVPVPAPDESSKSSPVPANDAPPLSEVVETYIRTKANLTPTVILDIRGVVRDLIEVVGDKPVNTYTRSDGRTFRDVLLRLPSNRGKRRALQGMGVLEAVAAAEELQIPPIAAKTVQLKRAFLSRVFAFAAADHDDVFDPFEANESWKAVGESAVDQKAPFAAEQLTTLLSADLPDWLMWLTRMALFTGARANELCQITASHVGLKPVPHIYLGPDLRLKSNAAVRSVPLHPKLIDLGILDFVREAGAGRLFSQVPVRELTGRHSDAASKAFSYQLRKLGLKSDKLSLHSLRHNWTEEWKRTHLHDVETRERLLGHAVAGVAGRYGAGYVGEATDMQLLEARAKLVDALRFDN